MNGGVTYVGGLSADTSVGPSRNLWQKCPWDQIIRDPNIGYAFWDDFLNFGTHVSDQDVQQYSSYIDTGVTIKQLATEVGGVIEVAGNDADNDEGSISTGGNSGVMGKVTASSGKPLWFEARVKKASIADNALAFFIGMSEEGLAAADTLANDTGEVASKDFIGFQTLHAEGETILGIYRKAGQNKGTVTGATATLVADTYIKVGFYFDGFSTLTYYINGLPVGTVTDISAATFPNDEELALLWATKVGAAAESKAQIDWWRFAQKR
jgi:hypothetical protein